MNKKLFTFLLAFGVFTNALCYTALPYHHALKDGTSLTLEMVEDLQADLEADVDLGLTAFAGAFGEATDQELETHFGPKRDIRAYYDKLFHEDDIPPFRMGEMIWIRAHIEQRLVGWMTILPNFQNPGAVYVSTLVVDPSYQSLGIGKELILSIPAHWFPECHEIDLVVRRINYQALPFYSHLGFEPAPDIDSPYLGDPTRCQFLRFPCSS